MSAFVVNVDVVVDADADAAVLKESIISMEGVRSRPTGGFLKHGLFLGLRMLRFLVTQKKVSH